MACLSAIISALLVALAAGRMAVPAKSNATNATNATTPTPIRKVITLIEEMKAQVEKDAAEDLTAYDKFMCWCQTNEKEKAAAIDADEARIEQLAAFVEEAAAKEGQLKTRIEALASEIAEDQDALAAAVANREKENAAFLAEEEDMKETRGLLKEAIDVLSKVQFLQKHGKASSADKTKAKAVLLQLQERVRSSPRASRFAGVMQKDLFDVFGSIDDAARQHGFLRAGTAFEQGTAAQQLLPWEKTEEQVGREAKPNELVGAAANAKSFNSRSGGILGMLAEMRDEFTSDLATAQKQELEALVAFQSLRAAKLGEIQAGTEAKEEAEADLADTMDQAAKAKEDREATLTAKEADEGFLGTMRKDCKAEDEQYQNRSKVRGEELVALGETLKILSEDDARDLFGSTVTLLQFSGASVLKSSSAELVAAQERSAEKAMQRLASVAKKHKNWAMASLAVRVRLDAFAKVREVMDKMLAELAMQQKEESEKREYCNKEIDATEDDIKVASNAKEDLEGKHQALVNALGSLARDIVALNEEEAEMKASLKEAGERRRDENQVYQQSVTDQRATINILNKALARLKKFYTPKFIEIRAHVQEPGRAVAARPDSPKGYAKSAGAGGVLQLIAKIITNAESAEKEMQMDEQNSQALYAEFVRSTTAAIEADRAAISEKSALSAEADAHISETKQSLSANAEDLEDLEGLLHAHHLDCDWLLKYYDVRQQARSEEMDAITDAKAVLAGADFGK